jgi:hypothetical protein
MNARGGRKRTKAGWAVAIEEDRTMGALPAFMLFAMICTVLMLCLT